MRHRRHRWLAAVLAFVLAFSQVVVAAYACPIDAPGGSTPFEIVRVTEPMPDCEAMPAQADPAPNLCEAHCLVAQQTQSDNAVFAAVAVLPALVVRTPSTVRDGRATFVDAETPLPTPPPLLRFARLLI